MTTNNEVVVLSTKKRVVTLVFGLVLLLGPLLTASFIGAGFVLTMKILGCVVLGVVAVTSMLYGLSRIFVAAAGHEGGDGDYYE